MQRQREVPLQAVKQIECTVKKEWMEKEWKFKETTSDEKMYTGRSYPAREYLHTITLERRPHDHRAAVGHRLRPAAAVQFRPARRSIRPQPKPERFLLNKRNKGEIGQDLKSLVYVKRIKLGKEALEEGTKKRAGANEE